MIILTLVIDGKDISQLVKDEGESIYYRKIHGNHEGTVLSGREVEEILAVKVDLIYLCEDLTWEQLKDLAVLFSKDIVSCTYYDPKIGANSTKKMKCEMSPAKKVLETSHGTYWGNVTLELYED